MDCDILQFLSKNFSLMSIFILKCQYSSFYEKGSHLYYFRDMVFGSRLSIQLLILVNARGLIAWKMCPYPQKKLLIERSNYLFFFLLESKTRCVQYREIMKNISNKSAQNLLILISKIFVSSNNM